MKHDVIAFLTNVGEYVGSGSAVYPCRNDIVRCARYLPRRPDETVGRNLLRIFDRLETVLARRALEFKTHGNGRSHARHSCRAHNLRPEARRLVCRNATQPRHDSPPPSNGSLSVKSRGRWERSNISARRSKNTCAQNWVSRPAPVSTQVLQRDRHAEFMNTLALIGSSLRKNGDRNPSPPENRSAGGRRVFFKRPEGLLGDAAQKEPDNM